MALDTFEVWVALGTSFTWAVEGPHVSVVESDVRRVEGVSVKSVERATLSPGLVAIQHRAPLKFAHALRLCGHEFFSAGHGEERSSEEEGRSAICGDWPVARAFIHIL